MVNVKEIENDFLIKLKDRLMNKEFTMGSKFPPEIPKTVGEVFILNLLQYFPEVTEFDVKPIVQGNVLLVKVEANKETTLVDVILPVKISEGILTINNVLASVKNMQ